MDEITQITIHKKRISMLPKAAGIAKVRRCASTLGQRIKPRSEAGMYSYLIEFIVKDGEEEKFVENWGLLTEYIHQEFGGLGSRLHKASDGKYIAYAQWPDSNARNADHPWTPEGRIIRDKMQSTLEKSQVIYELEVINNLLK